jgi:ATP-binding protein involved in chromosome partitioning
MNEEQIRNILRTVSYPGFSRDIVSFGIVRDIKINGGDVEVVIALTTADAAIPDKIREACETALRSAPGVSNAKVTVSAKAPTKGPAAAPEKKEALLPGVKAIVAVASGKGGVGKSTVSVNLACALDRLLKGGVGLLDCDIHGPSIPLMLGANERPQVIDGKIVPDEARGLKIMSMGLLLDDDSPVVWRGPMVTSAIGQFLRDVDWGELDVLVVDLPPGTGDAQLTLTQTIPVTGAVIVTTPQKAAVEVARRGAKMFARVNVPILGVVENMSYLALPDGSKNEVFGSGGGAEVARAMDCALIAQVPLDPALRMGCDNGLPLFLSDPQSPTSMEFLKAARVIVDKLNLG